MAGPTRRSGVLGICMGLVANCRQFCDPIFERRIAGVDNAVLDRLVEALQFRFGLGNAFAEFSDVFARTDIPFLAALQHLIHHHRQTLRVE